VYLEHLVLRKENEMNQCCFLNDCFHLICKLKSWMYQWQEIIVIMYSTAMIFMANVMQI